MAIKSFGFASAGGGAGTDNLDDVTSRGATTTNAITVGGVTVGTEYSLPTLDGSANQVLQTNGTGTVSFATLDFTGGLEYKGAFNATAGTPSLLNAEKGDFYIIDTAGTIYGQTWAVGDHLLINEDMGGTITNSKIDKIDNTQAVTSVNTQTGAVVLSGNDLLADHTAVNYTAANNNIDGHLSGIDSALGAVASPTLDDVTTNGDTTTNAINVGTITTSGDILADTADRRTIGAEDTRFITYFGDMNGAIRFKAKNDEGVQITKGQAVYIKGLAGDGTTPTVGLADANDASKMPAFGLAFNTASNSAEVQVVQVGNLTGLNTSGFSVGDTLYIDTTAGALVNTKPTGETSQLQNIGRVIRADNGDGVIMVGGAGRSAATPNLDQDKVFLGNASNQAVSTALSAIGLSKLNNDSGFISDITSESLNDLSDVSFTAGAGIDNYVLTYDHATTSWGAEAAAGGGEYTVSNQGSSDFTASNNTFYYVNTASGTTTTVTLPARTYAATDERIKFFNHGNGTLRVQEVSGTSRIHPDESGNDPGGTGQSYKDIGSRSVIEFLGIPNTYQWEWAISAQLELGKDTLANDGDVLRYDSSSDQMTALPYTFPTADGSANQILKTDGSGALTFVDGIQPTLTSASPSANYTISTHDGIEEIYVLTPSANISVFLPAASSCGSGYKYHIKNMASGFTLTIDANSTETIDGSTTVDIANQYEALTLISDDSNWFII